MRTRSPRTRRGSRAAWDGVHEHRITEATELKLDFVYDVPNADAAKELGEFLRPEAGYDVEFDGENVRAATEATTRGAAALDEWVEWTVLAGFENGRCKLEGCGADP